MRSIKQVRLLSSMVGAGLALAACGGHTANLAKPATPVTSPPAQQGATSSSGPAATTTTSTAASSQGAKTSTTGAGATGSTTTSTPPNGTGGTSASAPDIGCPAGDTQSGLACFYQGGDPARNPSGKVNPTNCPAGTSPEDGGCLQDSSTTAQP